MLRSIALFILESKFISETLNIIPKTSKNMIFSPQPMSNAHAIEELLKS